MNSSSFRSACKTYLESSISGTPPGRTTYTNFCPGQSKNLRLFPVKSRFHGVTDRPELSPYTAAPHQVVVVRSKRANDDLAVALAEARERGGSWAGESQSGREMLSAAKFGKFIGVSLEAMAFSAWND